MDPFVSVPQCKKWLKQTAWDYALMPKEAALAWMATSWTHIGLLKSLKSVLAAVKETPDCCKDPQTRFALGVLCLVSYEHARNRSELSDVWKKLHQQLEYYRYPVLFYGKNAPSSRLHQDLKYWPSDEKLEKIHEHIQSADRNFRPGLNNAFRFTVFSKICDELAIKYHEEVVDHPLFEYNSKGTPYFFEWYASCCPSSKVFRPWILWFQSKRFQEHLKPFLIKPSKELSKWFSELENNEQEQILSLRDQWGGVHLNEWYVKLLEFNKPEAYGHIDWSLWLIEEHRQKALDQNLNKPKTFIKAIECLTHFPGAQFWLGWDQWMHYLPKRMLEMNGDKEQACLWLNKAVTAFNKKAKQLQKNNQTLAGWEKYQKSWATLVEAWELRKSVQVEPVRRSKSLRL